MSLQVFSHSQRQESGAHQTNHARLYKLKQLNSEKQPQISVSTCVCGFIIIRVNFWDFKRAQKVKIIPVECESMFQKKARNFSMSFLWKFLDLRGALFAEALGVKRRSQ
jgi:hypothetical protein